MKKKRLTQKQRILSYGQWKRKMRKQLGGATIVRYNTPLGTEREFDGENYFESPVGNKRGWTAVAIMGDDDVGYWAGFKDWYITSQTHAQVMQAHWEGLN